LVFSGKNARHLEAAHGLSEFARHFGRGASLQLCGWADLALQVLVSEFAQLDPTAA
jgi:hypothetical protein